MRKGSIWNQREKANARFLTASGVSSFMARKDQTNKEQLYRIWDEIAEPQWRDKLMVDWDYRWNKSLYDRPVVLNLGNPLNVGGTHWVAVWKDKYFDSYGLPPSDILLSKGWRGTWNTHQIQGITAGRCGQYCLIWLKHVLENREEDFYKLFNIQTESYS